MLGEGWPGRQVVRQESAKLLYGGPIPPQASLLFENLSVKTKNARVVELVYTHDLKSCGEICAGSTPALGTKIKISRL